MIIGISGQKQSGKDTVAKMLQYFTLSDYSIVRTRQLTFEKWLELERANSLQIFKDYSRYDVSDWLTVRFADRVKDLVGILTNCTRYQLESEEFKNTPILYGYTPRQLLQIVGTDFGRNMINENIWVDLTLSNYTEDAKWIIPDVRFKNEVTAIQNLGGLVIRVIREYDKKDKHESEQDLSNFDEYNYVVVNDGTLDDLLNRVQSLYKIIEANYL